MSAARTTAATPSRVPYPTSMVGEDPPVKVATFPVVEAATLDSANEVVEFRSSKVEAFFGDVPSAVGSVNVVVPSAETAALIGLPMMETFPENSGSIAELAAALISGLAVGAKPNALQMFAMAANVAATISNLLIDEFGSEPFDRNEPCCPTSGQT
jgi:hypothetical protein